jgi:uncharacterized protein HemX
MSPQTSPKPIQDVAAPKQNTPSSDLIQTEIEHGIPVRNSDQPNQGNNPAPSSQNPITKPKQFAENDDNKNDPDLENILKDVNQNVAEQDKKPKKTRFSLFKKSESKKIAPSAKPKNSSKPMIAASAAILVACFLGIAAVFTFKQDKTANSQSTISNKAGSSGVSNSTTQTTESSLVQPADLSNLYSSLQSKTSSLNDDQDFNQADLSDQQLGL